MSITSEKGRRVHSRASRAHRHPRTQPNSITALPRLQHTELADKKIETDALNHAASLHLSFEVNCLGIFQQSAYIATLAPSRSSQGMSRMIFQVSRLRSLSIGIDVYLLIIRRRFHGSTHTRFAFDDVRESQLTSSHSNTHSNQTDGNGSGTVAQNGSDFYASTVNHWHPGSSRVYA